MQPPKDDDFLAPPDPCPQAERRHLGELARQLRQAAGLTRRQLAEQVGVCDLTILNFELARRLPTKDTLDRLLAHPALAQLVERAVAEGVAVRQRADPPALPRRRRVKA